MAKPDLLAWLEQARRAGNYYWAYAELVDDDPDAAKRAWEAGEQPYEYIKHLGLDLDLGEYGPHWGAW